MEKAIFNFKPLRTFVFSENKIMIFTLLMTEYYCNLIILMMGFILIRFKLIIENLNDTKKKLCFKEQQYI
jgi:hypothetical protein